MKSQEISQLKTLNLNQVHIVAIVPFKHFAYPFKFWNSSLMTGSWFQDVGIKIPSYGQAGKKQQSNTTLKIKRNGNNIKFLKKMNGTL